jgi:hypothetical protein
MRTFCIVILLALGLACFAQSDSVTFIPSYKKATRYRVVTTVGEVYEGFVTREDARAIVVEDRRANQSRELLKSGIASARPVNIRENVLDALGENDHAESYLFSSAAFTFKRGTLMSRSHWFLVETTDFALSKNVAISVNSFAFIPLSLGLKCAFEIGEETFVGFSAFGSASLQQRGLTFFGYAGQASFTKGNSNRNFTVSGGLLGLHSDLISGVSPTPGYLNVPYTSVAFCNRFSRHGAFVMEGWYLPESAAGMAGGGLRFLQDEHTCWSFGCFVFFSNYMTGFQLQRRTLPLPYLGLTRKF